MFEATSTGLSGSIQEWVALADGEFRITAAGAQGGGDPGGKGAQITALANLQAGDTLKVLVGQQGHWTGGSGSDDTASGGGGTFIVKKPAEPSIHPLRIGEHKATVQNSGASDVGRARVHARLRTSSSENMRIVHTTDDETFACYISPEISFNRYGEEFANVGDAWNDGQWHDFVWEIRFADGFAHLYADGKFQGTVDFDSAAHPVDWDELQLFQRDGGNFFDGDVAFIDIEVDGEPWARWVSHSDADALTPWEDRTGNDRHVDFDDSTPSYADEIDNDRLIPVLIAGGGGAFFPRGGATRHPDTDATTSRDGRDGYGSGDSGRGGTQGGGGAGPAVAGDDPRGAAAGGGFLGSAPDDDNAQGGFAFIRGGQGGSGDGYSDGGFGGGGGAYNGGGWGRFGGGGGYSGGGGVAHDDDGAEGGAGGGGSYIADDLEIVEEKDGENTGHGWAEIRPTEWLSGQAAATSESARIDYLAPYGFTSDHGLDHYELTVYDGNDEEVASKTTDSETEWLDGLEPDTDYTVEIVAVGDDGETSDPHSLGVSTSEPTKAPEPDPSVSTLILRGNPGWVEVEWTMHDGVREYTAKLYEEDGEERRSYETEAVRPGNTHRIEWTPTFGTQPAKRTVEVTAKAPGGDATTTAEVHFRSYPDGVDLAEITGEAMIESGWESGDEYRYIETSSRPATLAGTTSIDGQGKPLDVRVLDRRNMRTVYRPPVSEDGSWKVENVEWPKPGDHRLMVMVRDPDGVYNTRVVDYVAPKAVDE